MAEKFAKHTAFFLNVLYSQRTFKVRHSFKSIFFQNSNTVIFQKADTFR